MTSKEFLDDQDAEEPDDYIISITSLVNFLLSVVYNNFSYHFLVKISFLTLTKSAYGSNDVWML